VREESLYTRAGVDIEKANRLVGRIKSVVASTYTKGVITEIGGFAGLFALDHARYDDPVLVSSTDGVGTKLKVAFAADKHDTVGIDLVAMCVNDIIVTGAQPLFFLDYFATGRLREDIVVRVISGIAEGCRQAGCALIGGETAEMPGMYAENEYELAGFAVGVVDRAKIIDGSEIGVGHRIIGVNSSGLHSNGYSLVRKIFFEQMGLSTSDTVSDIAEHTLGEELLVPTKIYAKMALNIIKMFKVDAIVHITGGGFQDNIPRVLPKSCKAVIERGTWYIPRIFKFLKRVGGISEAEMLRVFNCGIGLIFIVPASQSQDILLQIRAFGEEAFLIGRIEERSEGDNSVEFRGSLS